MPARMMQTLAPKTLAAVRYKDGGWQAALQRINLHSEGVRQLHIEELKVGIVHGVHAARHDNCLVLLPSNLHKITASRQT